MHRRLITLTTVSSFFDAETKESRSKWKVKLMYRHQVVFEVKEEKKKKRKWTWNCIITSDGETVRNVQHKLGDFQFNVNSKRRNDKKMWPNTLSNARNNQNNSPAQVQCTNCHHQSDTHTHKSLRITIITKSFSIFYNFIRSKRKLTELIF